jgi:acetyl-CoA acetyltransferase
MTDVAIIGVGMHPFGRFPGKSAIDMAAEATRSALGDAGVQWNDVQFAFGGSYEVDNPDAVVNKLGLTGIPFTDVYNGCATAASAISLAAQTIELGMYDVGVAVGMDKHPVGAFKADPVQYSLPAALHVRPRHYVAMPGQCCGQGLSKWRQESECIPSVGAHRRADCRVSDGQRPAHSVHVL